MTNDFETYLSGLGMGVIVMSTLGPKITDDTVWTWCILVGLAIVIIGYGIEEL